jgi:hypothetical protein
MGISQLGMMNPRLLERVGGAGGAVVGISQLVALLSLRGGSGGGVAHLATVPGLRGGSGGVAHRAV